MEHSRGVEVPPPAVIDEQGLAGVVQASWGVGVERLRYLPKGSGSYHWAAESSDGRRWFVTVDDLDTKPWLGEDRDSARDGLGAAYDTARLLRQAGLEFVVGPEPSWSGQTVVPVGEGHTVSLFPFVEGHAGTWGRPVAIPERRRLVTCLAELHRSTPVVEARIRRRGLELPGRSGLETALGELDRAWSGGPFSEPARRVLATHAEDVRRLLGDFDALGAEVGRSDPELVVTHGEPHPGNVMRHGAEIFLIDWDTVALAPPERDLWMLAGAGDDVLDVYGDAGGRTLDGSRMALYRLAWVLTDIVLFTAHLRSEHTVDRAAHQALDGLTGYLAGRSADPYGGVSVPGATDR